MRDRTGNLPPMPGIFPDYPAPIARNTPDGVRELANARWGMPGPPQFVGGPITNIRNVNRKLITSDPYQFTRNPMYLGLVILAVGIAIWVGTWPMFGAPIALFATANWVHIPFEEAKMRRQFGAAYDDYVARVRRWI